MNPVERVAVPQGSATVDADNPWPGLFSFTEADADFFRGRDGEIDALHRLVDRGRLTVLFGLSGLGKSSLLLAGLFPLLRRQDVLPVYLRLGFQDGAQSLRLQTLTEVAQEAARCGVEAPAFKADQTLWEYFQGRDADFWDERNHLLTPVLVVDQFEEAFTLGRRNKTLTETTENFLTELADLAEGRPPASLQALLESAPGDVGRYSFARHNYKVILSLREDFLPELESLKPRMPSLALNRYRIQRMNGKAAFEVVAQAPHLIDESVARQVVRFVAAAKDEDADLAGLEVEPALLSVVCRELNWRRKKGEKITRDLLQITQGEILSSFYERSVADLTPQARIFIEDQLLTEAGYRDTVAEERALNSGLTSDVIEKLLQRRLLRREERGEVARLELTHDLLTAVVAASRDKRYREEAESSERKARLEAEARAAAVRKQLVRSRIFAAVFAVLALLAIAAAVWAWRMRQLAKINEERVISAKTNEVSARKDAEQTLNELVKRLQIQLTSTDPAQVGPAIEQLVSVYQLDPDEVLAGIPDDRFDSYPFSYGLVTSLDDAAADAQVGDWARRTRAALGNRLSKARKIAPPPSAADDSKLNPRILIKAGRFRMGSPEGQGEKDEHPLHWVQLSSFYMQQHEVTSEEYARFDPKIRSHHANITWYDALLYAVWVGGYLPTEAQWEYAARGTDGRKYSWGNEDPTGDTGRGWSHPDRPSAAGIRGLSGSRWEWCYDVYGPYPRSEQKDPTGPKDSFVRVLRGGSSLDRPEFMRAAYRYNYHPASSASNVGFRVAWKVSEDRR